MAFEVERINADGAAWLKATYLTIEEESKTAAGQMGYDSTKPDAAKDNPLAPTYSAMIGQSFIDSSPAWIGRMMLSTKHGEKK